jgi:hypothetical protein
MMIQRESGRGQANCGRRSDADYLDPRERIEDSEAEPLTVRPPSDYTRVS